MSNDFKGYALFNDIEDEVLRARNRATILANMCEDNTRDHLVSESGIELMKGYLDNVPHIERYETYAQFQQQMKDRGYVLAGEPSTETMH